MIISIPRSCLSVWNCDKEALTFQLTGLNLIIVVCKVCKTFIITLAFIFFHFIFLHSFIQYCIYDPKCPQSNFLNFPLNHLIVVQRKKLDKRLFFFFFNFVQERVWSMLNVIRWPFIWNILRDIKQIGWMSNQKPLLQFFTVGVAVTQIWVLSGMMNTCS